MPNEILTTLKLKDELTKGMEKVNKVMEKTERATAEQTKAFIEAGQSAQGFSTDIIGAEEELTKLFLAEQKAAKEGITLAEALDTSGEAAKKHAEDVKAAEKAQKASDKEAKGFTKTLGQMAKGLVGVSTAYAAGRWIINFGKESLAAADAAGLLPPAMKEAETSFTRLKQEVGADLGKTFEPGVKASADIADTMADSLQIIRIMNDARDRGVITEEKFREISEDRNRLSSQRLQTDQEWVNLIQDAERKTISDERIVGSRGRADKGPLSDVLRRRRMGLRKGDRERTDFDPTISEGLIRDVGARAGGAADIGRFQQAGGEAISEQFRQVIDLQEKGQISLSSYVSTMERLGVKAAGVAVAMGDMTLSDAAKQIASDMNVTYAEALQLLQGVNATLDDIDKKRVQAFLDIKVSTIGQLPPGFSGRNATGGAVWTAPTLDGGAASGGSGTIPPGFPNDSFTMGMTSGESFDIKTPGQQASGGGNAELQASMDDMKSVFRNGLLDLGQTIVEAMG